MMQDWWGSGAPGLGMVLGPLLMLFWFAALVWIAALIVRAVMARGGGETSGRYIGPSARQILDERFARGEIDEAEYIARRRVLRT